MHCTWVWIRLRPRNQRICPRRSSLSAWSISCSSSAMSSSIISSLPSAWPASFRQGRWLVGTVVMSCWGQGAALVDEQEEHNFRFGLVGPSKSLCQSQLNPGLWICGFVYVKGLNCVLTQNHWRTTDWLTHSNNVNSSISTCPHSSSPTPTSRHHSHCSTLSGVQLKGFPPNCTITNCTE